MTQPNDQLSIREITTYALPTFSINCIFMTVQIYLPNFVTDQLGITAGMLGWVFLFGRVWDAVTDPAVGHISDKTHTRWGRRRPYFLFCALPLWLCYYLLWSPSPSLSSTGTFIHVLLCYIGLFTFYTMFYIPHYSLGMEYTENYHERSRLFGGRWAFGIAGTITGTVAPIMFIKFAGGSKIVAYPRMGIVIGAICAGLILAMFFFIKEKQSEVRRSTYPFFKGLRVTFRNRAFVILMLTYMISLVGGSFVGPLALYMAKYVVKADDWIVQPLVLTYFASSLLAIPVWLRIAKKIGKNKTWSIALLIGAVGYSLIFTVGEGNWIRWILSTILPGMAAGCTYVIGPSLQADVVDFDELETGTRREGAYVGVLSFIDKAAMGLAVFIGLQVLQFIGYVPNVEQTRTVVLGITILYSFFPALLTLIALLIFQLFPITKEVHDEIRMKLDARKENST